MLPSFLLANAITESDEETIEKEPDDAVLLYKFLVQINIFENKNGVK